MYDSYYGLTGRPFQLTPDPAFYFESISHRKALSYLGYGLAQGEGGATLFVDPLRQGSGLALLADGDIPDQGGTTGDLFLTLRLAAQSWEATAGILGGWLGQRLAIRPEGGTFQITLALREENPFQAPLLIADPDHGLPLVGGLSAHLGVTFDNFAGSRLTVGTPLDHLR